MTTTKLDVVVVVAVVVVVSCGGDRGAGGAGGGASVSGRNSCIGGVGIEDVCSTGCCTRGAKGEGGGGGEEQKPNTDDGDNTGGGGGGGCACRGGGEEQKPNTDDGDAEVPEEEWHLAEVPLLPSESLLVMTGSRVHLFYALHVTWRHVRVAVG